MNRYNFYGDALLANIPADIKEITDNGNTIYAGFFDRGKVEEGTDIHEQPIWQITKTTISEQDDTTTVQTTFPQGSKIYAFKWSERANLNYEYSH